MFVLYLAQSYRSCEVQGSRISFQVDVRDDVFRGPGVPCIVGGGVRFVIRFIVAWLKATNRPLAPFLGGRVVAIRRVHLIFWHRSNKRGFHFFEAAAIGPHLTDGTQVLPLLAKVGFLLYVLLVGVNELCARSGVGGLFCNAEEKEFCEAVTIAA